MKKVYACGFVILLPVAVSIMSSQKARVRDAWIVQKRIVPPSLINCMVRWGSARVAGGCGDGNIYVYDIDSKESQSAVMTLKGHLSGVQKLAVMPDGKLVSISKDERIVLKLWNQTSGICEKTTESSREQYIDFGEDVLGFKGSVASLVAGSNGTCIVGLEMSTKAAITCWNPYSGKYLQNIGNISGVSAMAIYPRGGLVSGNQRGLINIWDAAGENSAAHTCLTFGDRKITSLCALSTEMLVIGYDNGIMKLCGGEMGKHIRKDTLKPQKRKISALDVLPNGTLISASEKLIKLWNIPSRTCIQTLRHFQKNIMQGLAVMSDELFVSADQRELVVWCKLPLLKQKKSTLDSASSISSSPSSSSSSFSSSSLSNS